MLVERLPVESRERPVVLGEVARHPVDEDADARTMQPVDEVPEVVRMPETARGRVVPGHLVSPRTAERMLSQGHELDVRVAELTHVFDELVRELTVAETRPPAADMQLVDAHRAVVRVVRRARRQPVSVGPLVPAFADDGCCCRRPLRVPRHRVGLAHPVAVLPEQVVLVDRAGRDAGNEELPHPCGPHVAHGVLRAVPVVEVADDAHRACVWRPHRETRPDGFGRNTEMGFVMRAERIPQAFMAALADEVQVQVADRRAEAVGIVGRPRRGAGVVGLDHVVLRPEQAEALPDAVREVPELDAGTVREHGDHLDGKWTERADRRDRVVDPVGAHDVLAEHRVRVVVTACRDGGEKRVWQCRQGDRGRAFGDRAHQGVPFTVRMWTGSVNASSRT